MVLKMVYMHICIQYIFVLACRVAGTTGSTSSLCFFLLLLHCSQHFVASACKINIVLVGRNQTPSYIDSSLKLIYLNRHFVKERRKKQQHSDQNNPLCNHIRRIYDLSRQMSNRIIAKKSFKYQHIFWNLSTSSVWNVTKISTK